MPESETEVALQQNDVTAERQQSSKSTSSYDLCQTHLSTRTVVVAVAAGGGLALGSLGGVRSTAPLLSYSDDVVPKLGLLPGNSK